MPAEVGCVGLTAQERSSAVNRHNAITSEKKLRMNEEEETTHKAAVSYADTEITPPSNIHANIQYANKQIQTINFTQTQSQKHLHTNKLLHCMNKTSKLCRSKPISTKPTIVISPSTYLPDKYNFFETHTSTNKNRTITFTKQ